MINWTPDPIAISIGPVNIAWYGVMYAIGLAVTYIVVEREARRRGLDTGILVNGMIIVAVAALVGGRLYHVIDQWDRYQDDLLSIVLPPYSGLGVYGGIITGFIAAYLYARWKRQPFLTWADCVAPGLLVMQAIARWGNFFNQELYGPPTDLPWGIAIDCEHRTPALACPPLGDTAIDAHFHPLFLYESISGAIGAVVLLYLARRVRWFRPGDIVLLFFMWYGTTRFVLETLRTNNWTFFDIPVASIVSATFVLGAAAVFAWRHRPGARAGEAAATAQAEVDAALAEHDPEPIDAPARAPEGLVAADAPAPEAPADDADGPPA